MTHPMFDRIDRRREVLRKQIAADQAKQQTPAEFEGKPQPAEPPQPSADEAGRCASCWQSPCRCKWGSR